MRRWLLCAAVALSARYVSCLFGHPAAKSAQNYEQTGHLSALDSLPEALGKQRTLKLVGCAARNANYNKRIVFFQCLYGSSARDTGTVSRLAMSIDGLRVRDQESGQWGDTPIRPMSVLPSVHSQWIQVILFGERKRILEKQLDRHEVLSKQKALEQWNWGIA